MTFFVISAMLAHVSLNCQRSFGLQSILVNTNVRVNALAVSIFTRPHSTKVDKKYISVDVLDLKLSETALKLKTEIDTSKSNSVGISELMLS